MSDSESQRDQVLEFIRDRVKRRRVWWTYHVNMRLGERSITRRMILDSADRYEIIESYPRDKYLPSYLIYTEEQGIQFHILIAVDTADDNVRIITAYRPDPNHWDNELKIRRRE